MKFAQLVVGPAGSGKVGGGLMCCACAGLISRMKMKMVPLGRENRCAVMLFVYINVQSTFCETMKNFCDAAGRVLHVVNLGEMMLCRVAAWFAVFFLHRMQMIIVCR